MKFIIQRVSHASVTVEDNIVGEIEKGFLVLIGISHTDHTQIADHMIRKLLGLRIFEDQQGKTNLSLTDVGGSLLLVSQFTLYADCKKGNRPSFTKAGSAELASNLFDYISDSCKASGLQVEAGIFAAKMQVNLTNEGPFTIILDSDEL